MRDVGLPFVYDISDPIGLPLVSNKKNIFVHFLLCGWNYYLD